MHQRKERSYHRNVFLAEIAVGDLDPGTAYRPKAVFPAGILCLPIDFDTVQDNVVHAFQIKRCIRAYGGRTCIEL